MGTLGSRSPPSPLILWKQEVLGFYRQGQLHERKELRSETWKDRGPRTAEAFVYKSIYKSRVGTSGGTEAVPYMPARRGVKGFNSSQSLGIEVFCPDLEGGANQSIDKTIKSEVVPTTVISF